METIAYTGICHLSYGFAALCVVGKIGLAGARYLFINTDFTACLPADCEFIAEKANGFCKFVNFGTPRVYIQTPCSFYYSVTLI